MHGNGWKESKSWLQLERDRETNDGGSHGYWLSGRGGGEKDKEKVRDREDGEWNRDRGGRYEG